MTLGAEPLPLGGMAFEDRLPNPSSRSRKMAPRWTPAVYETRCHMEFASSCPVNSVTVT